MMLNSHQYGTLIDVWSAGCSFAELLCGNYLFPGENYIKLLEMIVETLGTPSDEDLEFITNPNPRNYVKSLKYPGKDLGVLLGIEDPECVDLIKKMLVFNPRKRISIEEALKHPYLADFMAEEPYQKQPKCDFDFD